MNSIAFVAIAVLTLAAALAAATLQKLMHAALSFAVTFVGVAAFFFLLGAEFVGLVQVFVYVGAVAVLIPASRRGAARSSPSRSSVACSGRFLGRLRSPWRRRKLKRSQSSESAKSS